jgi:hypothetical protein
VIRDAEPRVSELTKNLRGLRTKLGISQRAQSASPLQPRTTEGT